MKSVFTNLFVTAMVLATAQASHAAAADGNVVCRGGGYTVTVGYIVAITDNPQVQFRVQKNNKDILEVSTDDNGNGLNFIHNAYSTTSDVDADGNIIHYGSGVAPTKFLAFSSDDKDGKETEPKLIEANLETKRLLIDNAVVAKLTCKDE